MGKYLIIQFKRTGRLIPILLLVAALGTNGPMGTGRGFSKSGDWCGRYTGR